MSFLPYSKVRLADGSYKSFNELVVGESIMTYTEGTGTFTFSEGNGADGTGMNVGTFGTSTIASIDSSSIVEDYINYNMGEGSRAYGVYYVGDEHGQLFTESKHSVDTLIYTQDGYQCIPHGDSTLSEGTVGVVADRFYLNSLEASGSISEGAESCYRRIEGIEFTSINLDVNDINNDPSKTNAHLEQNYIAKSTPMYKLTPTSGDNYIVGHLIVHKTK
jgi:hypothetical protein